MPHSTRLHGWKAIANHLSRTVRTVQRWEREQQLPVRRLLHNSAESVFADPKELEEWLAGRTPTMGSTHEPTPGLGARYQLADEATPYSVAIVPMLDLSPEQDQAPLCEGIVEELITALARVPGLRVPSRAAMHAALASDLRPEQLGRALNVSSILEGSVRKVRNRIRVSVRLVSTVQGTLLWSGSFNGSIEEVFEIQEGIARQVVACVTSRAPSSSVVFTRPHTRDMEAYTCYLRSRYHWNTRTVQGLRQAIELAERAIRLDPSYAEAHAALASAYVALSSYGAVFPKPLVSSARRSAEAALRLDPSLSDVHAILGITSLWECWNTEVADREFDAALSLDPRNATAYQWGSFSKIATGDLDKALHLSNQAAVLESHSLVIQAQVAWVLYLMRRFEEAIGHLVQLTRIDPTFWRPYVNLAWCYLQTGEAAKSIEAAETSVTLNHCTVTETILAATLASAGRHVEARQLLDAVVASTQYASAYWLAYALVFMNDHMAALDSLAKAVDERDWFVLLLKVEPAFRELHKYSRWVDLIDRIHPVTGHT